MENRLTYRHIFEATSNGAIVTDADGIIRFLNPQAESILQFKAAECVGTTSSKTSSKR